MQQLVKNRMKLQTPKSDISIQSYAAAKRTEFNSKYIRAQGTLYEKKADLPVEDDQPIYTKPYSTDGYLANGAHMKGENNTNAYTSITASDGFLSSKSISIAMAENSTSNTTTHQYDTKISIGVQTTDTLARTRVIKPCLGESQTSTIRVNKLTMNKQQQIRPKPIAYEIMFKEKCTNRDERKRQGMDKYAGEEKDNNFYQNSSKYKRSGSSSSELSGHGARVYSEGSQSTGSDNGYTLQEYLRKRKPEFYEKAELRRKCVNQLLNLR